MVEEEFREEERLDYAGAAAFYYPQCSYLDSCSGNNEDVFHASGWKGICAANVCTPLSFLYIYPLM